MIRKIFGSRIIALWLVMMVIGFCIGFAYTTMTSVKDEPTGVKTIQKASDVNADVKSTENSEVDTPDTEKGMNRVPK